MVRRVFGTTEGSDDASIPDQGERKAPPARRKPIVKGGAASQKYIQAATQGGADRTYQEIATDQIRESRIRDRIDINEDLNTLVESIRDNGQQIPILVRAVQGDQPYEIVVGRRRLAATKRLGRTHIKAFVARMDDREAFIAQGIENTARLETSYIERSRAAAQGVEAGFEKQDVAKFLNISRTLMSFMTRTYEALGEDLVLQIGPARGVGRRKWDSVVNAMARNGISPSQAMDLVNPDIEDSAARFEDFARKVQAGPARAAPAPAGGGMRRKDFLGGAVSTTRKRTQFIVKTRPNMPENILDMIQTRIEEIISEYEEERGNEEHHIEN